MSLIRTSPPSVWRKNKDIPAYLGKTGKIISYSHIHTGRYDIIHRAPYYIAIVELPDMGKNMMLEVCKENEGNIKIGTEVEVVHRKFQVSSKGLISYVLKGKVI